MHYFFHSIIYIDLLDDAGMGSGYQYVLAVFGGAYKNQEQHDNALHILDTKTTVTSPLSDYWAKELVKILTNGKMTVDYHFGLVSK